VEGDVWGSFAHDPRDPAVSALRASDADREVIHGVLAEAFADGRLDRAEYDERSAAVLAARTLGELPPVVADLVPALPSRTSGGRVPLVAATSADLERLAEEKWREDRRNAVFGFLGPTLICWTIWVATSQGFPWPAIVMAVTFLNLLKTVTSREAIVASEVRRLERKRAKEIQRKHDDGDRP
jgi:hypothetical protein